MTMPPGNSNPDGGYPPPGSDGYGYGAPQPSQNNAPMILGIVGLVCIILCWPAGIVLGLVGQQKAHQNGQSATLPKVAWILSIVAGIISILTSVFTRMG